MIDAAVRMKHAASCEPGSQFEKLICALMGCTLALVLEAFELILTAHALLKVRPTEASTLTVCSGTRTKIRKRPRKFADRKC